MLILNILGGIFQSWTVLVICSMTETAYNISGRATFFSRELKRLDTKRKRSADNQDDVVRNPILMPLASCRTDNNRSLNQVEITLNNTLVILH